MAILVLASTISWTVGKHYCMGHLVEVTWFSTTGGCEMELMGNTDDMDSMDCCDDQQLVIEGQDNLQQAVEGPDVGQQPYMAMALGQTDFSSWSYLRQYAVPHNEYPPPLLVKNIQLFDGIFLI
ncbi:MAG: hypothetical protein AB3N16_11040 [Flavobacteriaceae bacterium]